MQFGRPRDNLLTLAGNAMDANRLLKSISAKLYSTGCYEVAGNGQWPLLLMIVVFAAIILIVNLVRENVNRG